MKFLEMAALSDHLEGCPAKEAAKEAGFCLPGRSQEVGSRQALLLRSLDEDTHAALSAWHCGASLSLTWVPGGILSSCELFRY
jgi:hypothetical protein